MPPKKKTPARRRTRRPLPPRDPFQEASDRLADHLLSFIDTTASTIMGRIDQFVNQTIPPPPGPQRPPGSSPPPRPPHTPPQGTLSLYDALEVSPRASPETIEAAYKSLAVRFHPDKHEGKHREAAESHMKTINMAYQILKDPAKRAQYDLLQRNAPR